MSEQLNIKIDGKPVLAEPGQMIIQAADKAGIYIPRFCYHKKLSIAANCRMCLIQVGAGKKPMPACATPIIQGMEIYTKSQVVLQAQKAVMEFLLINHPLDCPICDQGGQCELQDLAMGYGSDISRYTEGKRVVKDKNIGALIATDMTRCIHCTRCVRFGSEIAGVPELGLTDRGEHTEIGTYVEQAMISEVSGNVIDVCPVGALTAKPSRFNTRAWEVQQYPTIAAHDCLGANIYAHLLRRSVMRVIPRENEAINEVWLSDRDRFSYQGLQSKDRLGQPMIKREGQWKTCDWQTALEFATEGLQKVLNNQGGEQVGALISPNATLEEQYLSQKLLRGVGSNNIDHRLQHLDMRDQEAAPLFPSLGLSIAQLENLQTCLLIGSDIQRDQPLAALRLRKMVKQGGYLYGVSQHGYQQTMPWTKQVIARYLVGSLAKIASACGVGVENVPADNDAAETIAKHLQQKGSKAIILGMEALHHPQAAELRYLAKLIAEKTGASFGELPFGANSVGAWLSGCVPHRCEAGGQITPGLSAQQMLEQALNTYLLFNIEPEFDCANPTQALASLKMAEFVVSFTPYLSETIQQYADILLPITPFTETSGTFINIQGDWQSFTAVNKSFVEARPGWKVLRVLGNFLRVSEFDFESSEAVRSALQQALKDTKLPDGSWQTSTLSSTDSGVQRIASIAMYRGDNITRRAKALQATPINQAIIAMNSQLAQQLSVQVGQLVKVCQGQGEAVIPVVIDDSIADQCVYIPAGFVEVVELCGSNVTVDIQAC